MDWFSLITIVFILGVSGMCYKWSGWYWFLLPFWSWSHVMFMGPVTLVYLACMLFLAVKKNPIFFIALFIWDWPKVFLLTL